MIVLVSVALYDDEGSCGRAELKATSGTAAGADACIHDACSFVQVLQRAHPRAPTRCGIGMPPHAPDMAHRPVSHMQCARMDRERESEPVPLEIAAETRGQGARRQADKRSDACVVC